jgi:restriction system protein
MYQKFRRNYSRPSDDEFLRPVIGLAVLYSIWIYYLFISHNSGLVFWLGVGAVGLMVLFLVLAGLALLGDLKRDATEWASDIASETMVKTVRKLGLEHEIKSFIDRWGMDGKKNSWMFREHSFDWERLKDFRGFLREKGLKISEDKWEDVFRILRHYIQQKERKLTLESISTAQQLKFSGLSPSDFENLLYRLFQNMGYAVQRTGRTGDQGADLIANQGADVRLLIQAKRYNGHPVGNSAVQEAVAAQKYYSCNGAMVVTSASFTKEAGALAKANNVGLVGGHRLSELLLQYLKESWS